MHSNRRKLKRKQTKSKTLSAKRPKKASNEKQPKAQKKVKKRQSIKEVSSKPSKGKTSLRREPGLESSPRRRSAISSQQSGDLAGLSRFAQADSESVNELVEEGNIAEAGAVAGVEEADDQDTKEVHTHEIAEDDVPDEYLDKD